MSKRPIDTSELPLLEFTIDANARRDILKGNGIDKACKKLIREREGRGRFAKSPSHVYRTLYTYYWFDGETNNMVRINELISFVTNQNNFQLVNRICGDQVYISTL